MWLLEGLKYGLSLCGTCNGRMRWSDASDALQHIWLLYNQCIGLCSGMGSPRWSWTAKDPRQYRTDRELHCSAERNALLEYSAEWMMYLPNSLIYYMYWLIRSVTFILARDVRMMIVKYAQIMMQVHPRTIQFLYLDPAVWQESFSAATGVRKLYVIAFPESSMITVTTHQKKKEKIPGLSLGEVLGPWPELYTCDFSLPDETMWDK